MKRRLFIIALLSTFLSTLSCIPCCGQKHQRGKASYYSKRATVARSASGQRIHHDSLTCAHRYYPFGTMLKITNLRNDKSVIVEVIDRGPFGRVRIIDLSWAAAKEIDMISQGVATVKVERLDNPVPFKPEDSKLPKIDFEMAEFEPKHYFEKKEKAREKAEAIFASGDDSFMSEEKESEHLSAEQLGISENETLFSDLAISRELVKKLEFHDVYTAEEFFDLSDEEVAAIGLTEEEKAEIASVIDLEEEQEEQFECPNCGAVLPAGTTHCPSCGVEFEFE